MHVYESILRLKKNYEERHRPPLKYNIVFKSISVKESCSLTSALIEQVLTYVESDVIPDSPISAHPTRDTGK